MSGLIATPPQLLINPDTGRLHVETCPAARTTRDRLDPIFTGWNSRDLALAITGRDLHPCRGCKPITRIASWERKHLPLDELATLATAVDDHRWPTHTEDALQEALATVMPGRREVTLSLGGRVDLLVGRIAVEVKTAGTAEAAYRQVRRYAASPEVAGLLLVSTREEHLSVTASAGGKPVRVAIARGRI